MDSSAVVRKVQDDHWTKSVHQRDATLQRNGPALLFLWHSGGGERGSPWQGGLSADAAKDFRTQQVAQSTHPSYKVTNPGSHKEFQEVYSNINSNR